MTNKHIAVVPIISQAKSLDSEPFPFKSQLLSNHTILDSNY